MGKKINNKTKIITLFSKINSGSWPNIYSILNKIMKHVPLLNLKITLFNKEEGLDEKEKETEILLENFKIKLPPKLYNIKVNLYEYYPEQLEKYFYENDDSLDQIFNPKRRIQILKEEIENNNNKYTKAYNNIITQRPKSSYTYSNNNNSILTERIFSNTNFNNSLNSTLYSSNTNNSKNNKSKLFIEDSTQLKKMKGKLLSSAFSDKEGIILLENVPYDSYIIEVENCQNFKSCGIFLQFKKIFEYDELNNPYKNKLFTYNRIIGLTKQIDSYVQVFLYFINEEGKNELINNAKVTLIRKYFGDNDLYLNDDEEFNFEENKNIKGRYEIITTPGECIIKVFKIGFEETSKEVNLKLGENKINIELKK